MQSTSSVAAECLSDTAGHPKKRVREGRGNIAPRRTKLVGSEGRREHHDQDTEGERRQQTDPECPPLAPNDSCRRNE